MGEAVCLWGIVMFMSQHERVRLLSLNSSLIIQPTLFSALSCIIILARALAMSNKGPCLWKKEGLVIYNIVGIFGNIPFHFYIIYISLKPNLKTLQVQCRKS